MIYLYSVRYERCIDNEYDTVNKISLIFKNITI